MKAQIIRCKIFSEASTADLQTAINDWFATSGERTFLSATYQSSPLGGEPFTCLVFYAE